jgi:hypothetical protein
MTEHRDLNIESISALASRDTYRTGGQVMYTASLKANLGWNMRNKRKAQMEALKLVTTRVEMPL